MSFPGAIYLYKAFHNEEPPVLPTNFRSCLLEIRNGLRNLSISVMIDFGLNQRQIPDKIGPSYRYNRVH